MEDKSGAVSEFHCGYKYTNTITLYRIRALPSSIVPALHLAPPPGGQTEWYIFCLITSKLTIQEIIKLSI